MTAVAMGTEGAAGTAVRTMGGDVMTIGGAVTKRGGCVTTTVCTTGVQVAVQVGVAVQVAVDVHVAVGVQLAVGVQVAVGVKIAVSCANVICANRVYPIRLTIQNSVWRLINGLSSQIDQACFKLSNDAKHTTQRYERKDILRRGRLWV